MITERTRAVRRLGVMLAALIAVAGLAACGVSSSGSPTKIGDAYNANAGGGADLDQPQQPPAGPSRGENAEQTVRSYLQAAAGGDDGLSERLRAFLTGDAEARFRNPPSGQSHAIPLTVIRIVGVPVTRVPVNGRIPVDIRYQVVGSLNDDGLVNDLPGDPSQVRTATFQCVPQADNSLQIDDIEGTDLPPVPWISDDTLKILYRPQTIYFWDATNTHLIPDLRYLPLTLSSDQRAGKIVQWLLDAPSPWLAGPQFAQRLPPGATTKVGVINQNGTWMINLSAASATGGPDAVRRLYDQLEMSLRSDDSTPSIQLSIENVRQAMPSNDDYLHFNLFFGLDQAKRGYDIQDGKVVAADTAPAPNVLKSPENADVAYAAVDRLGTTMALVRKGPDGKRYLELVQDGGAKVDTLVPHSTDIGRPTFIPGSNLVVVPANGHLLLVEPNGNDTDITPPRRDNVTSVSVAPDGRRIAWVASGQAFVAPLTADGRTVSIGANPRAILANQLNAQAIAWTGEAWLYVVGLNGQGGTAIFRTTVDSAIAQDASSTPLVSPPTDVIALANASADAPGEAVYFTNQGCYTSSTTGPQASSNSSKNPFYVT